MILPLATVLVFKEQVSTMVPNFAFAHLSHGLLLVGECLPQTLRKEVKPYD